MESLTFHITPSKEARTGLWEEIWLRIEKEFSGEPITISIQRESSFSGSSEPLSAFEQRIIDAKNESVSFVFKDNEFEEFAEQMLRGETVDTERYKRISP
ncbi:MAG: hypothetical protein MUF71_12715 [Candidatus Kapabacteria bacterium]|jgi:hypothetical protein|nr:hypothetical protein [Candidatus Kapabacteria bacterium]